VSVLCIERWAKVVLLSSRLFAFSYAVDFVGPTRIVKSSAGA